MVNPLDALCFHRRCKYGGEDEYYVQIRETGNLQQEKVDTEHHEEVTRCQETQTLIPSQLLTDFPSSVTSCPYRLSTSHLAGGCTSQSC